MPKLTDDVLKQIRQVVKDTGSEVIKQPVELVGKAMEQVGLPVISASKEDKHQDDESARIEQLQRADKQRVERQSLVLKQELQSEITKWSKTREHSLVERRQEPVTPPQVTETLEPLVMPTAKPKKGTPNLGVKSAQQKAQPEMVGKRVSG